MNNLKQFYGEDIKRNGDRNPRGRVSGNRTYKVPNKVLFVVRTHEGND